VIPGPRTGVYRLNAKVLEIVRHFANAKKPIAALCHGAQVLAAAGVLQGKKCSCYRRCRRSHDGGGTFADVAMTEAVVGRQSGERAGVAGASNVAGEVFGSAGTRIEA